LVAAGLAEAGSDPEAAIVEALEELWVAPKAVEAREVAFAEGMWEVVGGLEMGALGVEAMARAEAVVVVAAAMVVCMAGVKQVVAAATVAALEVGAMVAG